MSALLTGLLLPRLTNYVGLSVPVLQGLGLMALLFSTYSLICYFVVKRHKLWMLLLIMMANLHYCGYSMVLLLTSHLITDLGKAILIAEILAILGIVALEFKVYRSHARSRVR